MKIKKLTVYAAHGDPGSDGVSSESGAIVGLYTTEAGAEMAAVGQGYRGGDGAVTTRKALKIGEDVYLLDRRRTDPIRVEHYPEAENVAGRRAHAPSERTALGPDS